MVVLAHSAVLRVREKTTLRAASRMPENGWSAVGKAPAMAFVGVAAHEVRVRAQVHVEFRLRLRRVVGQAEAELPVLGALVGEKAVE
jgi:hypothetical protein